MRIYLTGRVAIENGETLVEERELAGRQGRLAFAFLAGERHRPIPGRSWSSVVWRDTPPSEIETALNAILSKLRSALEESRVPTARRRGASRHDRDTAARRCVDRPRARGKSDRRGRRALRAGNPKRRVESRGDARDHCPAAVSAGRGGALDRSAAHETAIAARARPAHPVADHRARTASTRLPCNTRRKSSRSSPSRRPAIAT